jgi:general secretion pathway protein M
MNAIALTSQIRQYWHASWSKCSPREQQLLSIGVWLMGVSALWLLALEPALHTWREAPARQAQLDTQNQRMRQLQAQAQSLQQPRAITRSEATLWLGKNLNELGPNARISVQGDSATLNLQEAPAAALALWLRLARDNAQALPIQAQLQQASSADPNSTDQKPQATWRGSLVLRLP